MSSQPPSVRYAPGVQRWLDRYSGVRPAWDRAGGPSQPRVAAVTPDAAPPHWQVIREVRDASTAAPGRTRADIVAAVAGSTGVAPEAVTAAIAYWAAHPDEVSARLRA